MIAGLILAGGRSSRFGREKAAALLDGVPMIEAVRAVLRLGADRVAVNARAGSEAAVFAAMRNLPCLPDPERAPAGPLSGVLEGLRWAASLGAQGLVTSPCDTPFLPMDLVPLLAAGDEPAMAATAEGPQPLTAYWPVSAADALERALAIGEHPAAHKFLKQLGAREIFFEEAWRFSNINTLEDYAMAVERVAARPPPPSGLLPV